MYQSLLCLVALSDENRQVVRRARELADHFDADLHMLHVVEYVPLTGTEDAMLTAPISISDELEQRAREQMGKLAKEFSVATDRCHVVTGDLVSELNTAVEEYRIGLVVVGNHCRKGLAALFDHAEDAVLHRCACDLLAVHLS